MTDELWVRDLATPTLTDILTDTSGLSGDSLRAAFNIRTATCDLCFSWAMVADVTMTWDENGDPVGATRCAEHLFDETVVGTLPGMAPGESKGVC